MDNTVLRAIQSTLSNLHTVEIVKVIRQHKVAIIGSNLHTVEIIKVNRQAVHQHLDSRIYIQ